MHLAADAVADEALDHREAGVANVSAHLRGHLAPATLLAHQVDGQIQHAPGDVQQPLHLGLDLADRSVTAESPHQPSYLQPVSMLTMSPSRNTRRPGNAVHHFSLTEMQVTAGKGTLPGTPLNSGMALMLVEKLLDRGVDLAGGDAGLDQLGGDLVSLPDQQAGLAHLGDFTR